MKRLIIIFLLIAAPAIAKIPGYIEFESDISRYKTNANDDPEFLSFYTAHFRFTWGSDFNMWNNCFNIYGYYDYLNYFEHKKMLSNYPFRDEYTIGAGAIFFDIFYFEFSHICSHRVISADKEEEQKKKYDQMTQYTHNVYRVGCKFRFE